MRLSPRVQSTGRLLAIAALLVATYLLFAITSMRVALKVREVQVPDLRNHTVAEATAALDNAGLVLAVDERPRIDPKIPAGRIAAQDPPPGGTTRRQRSIHVWVSQGAHVNTIPALVGQPDRAAEIQVKEDGLNLAGMSEVRSDEYPSGTVIAQEPPAASRGGDVALLVNRGEQNRSYVMPDLIGVAGNRAVDLMRAHGFRVTIVGELAYPGVPGGIVLRQAPSAGFQIHEGDAISLEVSR